MHLALDKSMGFFAVLRGSYAKMATSARPHSFTSLIHVAVEVRRAEVAKGNSHSEVSYSAE